MLRLFGLHRLPVFHVLGLFFTAALTLSVPCSAAVTYDASSSGSAAAVTSLTFNHTLGAGANRVVVCDIAISNPTASVANVTPTVTFGTASMTAIPTSLASAGSTSKVESIMFYANDAVLSGLSGSQTVTVTLPSAPSGGTVAGCTSFFGVAQSAPESAVAYYNGSGGSAPATATVSVASAGDLIVDGLAGGYTASSTGKTAAPNSPQVQSYLAQLSTSGVLGGSSYEFASASGSVSVGWADSVSRLGYSAVAFAAAPTASYTVSTAVSPTGGGTVALNPSGGTYPDGTSVQVTANPAIGYTFSSFSGGLTSTVNPASVIVHSNLSITANFVASMCTLTINVAGPSGAGTVTPASGSSYVCGTQVQVTATPNAGYSFGQFSGALTGAANPQTLTLTTSSTVTATFVSGTACTLSTSVTGSGSITVDPAGTVFTCGTPLTITAVPAQYYSLSGFSGAITGTANPQNFTINSNSTISAAFAQTSFPINTTIVGLGTVTADPSDSGNGYPSGTQVQLTAAPASGYTFAGFSGDLTGATNPQTLTVNGTKNVTATFQAAMITKDAVSHGASTASASTLTWTHTIGSGGSRALVIAVGEADSSAASPDQYAAVTSVTYNGVYATPVPNSVVYGGTSGMAQSQLFYLLESELPSAGTYPVQVNLAGPVGGISAGAVSLIGVNQGPAEAVATNKATTGVDSITSTITTLTNNAWVIDALEDGDRTTLTAGSGQTIAWQAEATTGTGASSTDPVAMAGPVSLSWAGSANRLVHSLAAFPPASSTVPATYTLTTSVAGGVGGTVASNPSLSSYPVSTGVLLTATAATGYAFSSWSGDYTSSTNPLPITMDTNRNVVANFTVAPTCNLTVNVEGSGTVTPTTGAYNCGTVLHFVATAGSGYTFTSYSGDFSSVDNPADFTLNADSTVNVEFDPIPTCALNITTAGSGTVTPASGSYTCGSVITLQATANSGYGFSGYSGDFTSTANPASVQLNQNMNITATFTAGNPCTLTTSVVGQGTIVPSSGSWACGTTIGIEADAASRYIFNGWSGDLTTATSPTTLTLNTNKSVTATFVVNIAGVTGDTRTVTEPSYPPVCTVLSALQTTGSLVESSPDTARVQAALNACPVGQAVEFSANGTANAFIIQPITLPAGVTMLVDPEVTIYGSINSADYACISSESYCTPLIDVAPNSYPNPGSAIMGLGVIDGRGGVALTDKGKSWWATGSDARPRLVFLSSHYNTVPADNFTMYKITLKNSPKFEFSGIGNDLTIWGIRIIAPPDSPNTDGIDPSSSQNITITNSFISDGDDMIAMKAGNGHIANVTISNNHMYSGHGITVGSETNAGLNNMLVINNAIDNGFGGTSVDSLRIKSDTSRGGEVYDVLYKNTCVNHGGDTIVIDPYYSSQSGNLIPNFHDITVSNFTELIRDSSHKCTLTGYNTNGIVNPLTLTLDNVNFDGAVANDFKAPDYVNNTEFTLGPGPVNIASFLTTDAATPSNFITVTDSISNPSQAPLDCSTAFVYLTGDLTAPLSTVTAGSSPTITAVLQNVVSPLTAGTISYPQQNAPTGNVQLYEGTNQVGTATALNGRLAYITIPNITAGSHTYTAKYLGDSHYGALAFGSFTLIARSPAPVALNQTVSVNYNTATPITLNATGSGAITYSVVTNPAHGMLSGTAPSLTYTPTTGYVGADTFTFKANNGTDSNVATVSITVSGGGSASQTISFPAPATPVTYSAVSVTLSATASSNLPVTFTATGPAIVSGNTLSFTGAGTVMVTASQAGNSTYSAATPVVQTIVVNPAMLTIVVSGSPSRYFGQANPSFGYGITGFVGSDTQASSTTGQPTLTTIATPQSAPGSYPITVSIGTLTATNYTFTAVNGQLTVVGGSPQAIAFPPLPSFLHGTTALLLANSTSGLPVTFTVTSGPATMNGNSLTVTGAGTVTITATQPGNSSFSAAPSVARTFTAQ